MSNEMLRERNPNPGRYDGDEFLWNGTRWRGITFDNLCDGCPYACALANTEEAIGCTVLARCDGFEKTN